MIGLAVDWGTKRIGLAIGNSATRLPAPLEHLAASGSLKKDAAHICALAASHEAKQIIIGVPVLENAADGGKMQKLCRKLAEEIRGCGWVVFTVDESFSSREAAAELSDQGIRGNRTSGARDSASAMILLERFWQTQTEVADSEATSKPVGEEAPRSGVAHA